MNPTNPISEITASYSTSETSNRMLSDEEIVNIVHHIDREDDDEVAAAPAVKVDAAQAQAALFIVQSYLESTPFWCVDLLESIENLYLAISESKEDNETQH